jgi:hypothetical protein
MLAKITIMFMMLTTGSTIKAHANECTLQEEQIKACEQVIKAGHNYIQGLLVQLEQKDELAISLEKEVALLKQRANDLEPKWFERPSFVVPVTVVSTVLAVVLIRNATR